MSLERQVSDHYAVDGLVETIRAGFEKMGKPAAELEMADLSLIDEFHIGGRAATEHFAESLAPTAGEHWLDIGCGIGGAARFMASSRDCKVSGIDLTPDYVVAGRALSQWVGLEDRTAFHEASALELPFDDGSFDGAYTIHVAMNIPDKAGLYGEARRVLKPGARFGLYDVMALDERGPIFPAPWAESADTSAVITADAAIGHLRAAGFEVLALTSRRDFGIDFFDRTAARMAGSAPPPIGMHTFMGANAREKLANMRQALADARLAPTEIICRAF